MVKLNVPCGWSYDLLLDKSVSVRESSLLSRLDENKIGGVSASADESKKMELSVHVRVSGGLLVRAVRCQHPILSSN